jgi:pimeloyl-ACP methyl ester carboxylesterase
LQTDLDSRIARFPQKTLVVGGKALAYRESGEGPALVLLHGIGSGSASWLFQLEALAARFRVVAWDAPGYGGSDAFSIDRPRPEDYARPLSVLTGALQLRSFVLVAQSLGALIAGAYARMFPAPPSMLLISPAGGYAGDLSKVEDRLRTLEALGPDGLAEKRAAGMLSPAPPALALELVRWNYRRIRREGDRHAAYCLAQGNLREDAPHYTGRVLVACGSADTVTPQAACREIAARFPVSSFKSLPGLGHASQIEGPEEVNRMIGEFAC